MYVQDPSILVKDNYGIRTLPLLDESTEITKVPKILLRQGKEALFSRWTG